MATIVADEQDPAASATAEPTPTRARYRGVHLVGLAGIATLAVPFVAAIAVAIGRPWLPSADPALMELRILDVGGPHTPLLGAYSRLGFHHPGPVPFWLLAVPYRAFALFGAPSAGMLVGTAAGHAAAAIGAVALARRLGGRGLAAAVALGLAVLLRSYGAGYLVMAWNPDLAAIALAVLILATFAVLNGRIGLLPVVVGVSCYAWQSHVGYLPMSGLLAAIGVAGAAVAARRRWHTGELTRARAARVALATAATAAVFIVPMLVEQATNDPGNLRRLAHALRHPEEQAIGAGRGAAIAAAHLSPVGTWVTGDMPMNPFTTGAEGRSPALLLVPIAAVALAAWAAWRARDHGALRFLGVTAAAAAAGVLAAARTTGEPYQYLFTWFRPISMLLWVSVGWALVRAARNRRWWPPGYAGDRLGSAATVAAALATGALSVASLSAGTGLTLFDEDASASVRVLAPATVSALAERGVTRVALTMGGGWCAGELGHGLGVRLVEQGIEVAVDPSLELPYGTHRVGQEGLPRVELICGVQLAEVVATSPAPPIASVGLLTPAEVAELQALQDKLRSQVQAAGRDDLLPAVETRGIVLVHQHQDTGIAFDPADIARYDQLLEKGRRAGVVFFHPAGP